MVVGSRDVAAPNAPTKKLEDLCELQTRFNSLAHLCSCVCVIRRTPLRSKAAHDDRGDPHLVDEAIWVVSKLATCILASSLAPLAHHAGHTTNEGHQGGCECADEDCASLRQVRDTAWYAVFGSDMAPADVGVRRYGVMAYGRVAHNVRTWASNAKRAIS